MSARQRVDNGIDSLLDLRIGQRALGMLKRQADRQTDLPGRHALALIPIELANRHECSGSAGADSATNIGCWQAFVNENGEIAHG